MREKIGRTRKQSFPCQKHILKIKFSRRSSNHQLQQHVDQLEEDCMLADVKEKELRERLEREKANLLQQAEVVEATLKSQLP